jgi:DNA polymerase-3 subunit delta'
MISDETIIHPRTLANIQQFIKQPSHSLFIEGPDGIGKTTIAKTIASELIGIDIDKLSSYPYLRIISPEPNTISIDTIRDLQHFLQLKTVGVNQIRRVAIIEHGDMLTLSAQSALLKSLEEPPVDTLLTITANTSNSLLPTLISRLQKITVHSPTLTQIKNHFILEGKSQAEVDKMYFLGGGLPGLMNALLEEDSTHPLVSGVVLAKELLVQSKFDRLLKVDLLSKNKEEASFMVEALLHIAKSSLEKASNSKNDKQLRQWHHILKAADEARNALNSNANTKLVLTNLMLQV